jgi:hypothetical protein
MKVTWTRAIVFVCALVVVIAAGVYSSDHLLKATDGDENFVEADTSADAVEVFSEVISEDIQFPEDEENVALEQGTMDCEETETSDKSVVIDYVIMGDDVGVGAQVKLTAVLTGYENPVYQWQYHDGTDWKDIEGATEASYVFEITQENCSYDWRVNVEEE